MTQTALSARAQAALMRDLVDVLIPGDETWPSAGLIGVQAQLCTRLLEREGEAGPSALIAALLGFGAPLENKTAEDRIAVVRRFENGDPDRFRFVRDAVYFAYYDSPIVIEIVQSLGQPYRAIPVHEGYRQPPFDRERDTPRHGRGAYVPTEAVTRVDLSGLAHLAPRSSP